MRIACWIPKTTDTHSLHEIFVAFPQRQRLHERAPKLRYTYTAVLVTLYNTKLQIWPRTA